MKTILSLLLVSIFIIGCGDDEPGIIEIETIKTKCYIDKINFPNGYEYYFHYDAERKNNLVEIYGDSYDPETMTFNYGLINTVKFEYNSEKKISKINIMYISGWIYRYFQVDYIDDNIKQIEIYSAFKKNDPYNLESRYSYEWSNDIQGCERALERLILKSFSSAGEFLITLDNFEYKEGCNFVATVSSSADPDNSFGVEYRFDDKINPVSENPISILLGLTSQSPIFFIPAVPNNLIYCKNAIPDDVEEINISHIYNSHEYPLSSTSESEVVTYEYTCIE